MGIATFYRRLRQMPRRWRYAFRRGISIDPSVRIGERVRLKSTDGAQLEIGTDVQLGNDTNITAKFGRLAIGAATYVGPWSVVLAREHISIGQDCLIAEFVVIRDQNHAIRPGHLIRQSGFDTAPITIGNNVWIGAKATILPGVTIGDNTVIGANSVVTRDVPANTVFAGVPARKLRNIG